MTCPNCGYEQWKSASMVHKEGASTLTSTSVGVGVSTGGIGVGSVSTSGEQQTELSKRARPPETFVWTTRCLFGAIIAVVLGFAAATFWWAVAAVLVVALVLLYRSESKEDDVLTDRYKNTRVCTRCGTFYVAKPSR